MDRVLAFGCHPDDLEFMAAGTLALLAERGYEVHVATMTGGDSSETGNVECEQFSLVMLDRYPGGYFGSVVCDVTRLELMSNVWGVLETTGSSHHRSR